MSDFGFSSGAKNMELNLVKQIIAGAGEGLSQALIAFSEALKSNIGNRNDLAQAHQNVASQMRTSVQTAYAALELRPSYRTTSPARMSGGIRRLMASTNFVVGTARGIDFVYIPDVATEAKHLGRLNFGTLGTGSSAGGGGYYPFMLFGQELFNVGFNEGPRPAFKLPAGLFWGGGAWHSRDASRTGQDIFYPVSELANAHHGIGGDVARAKAIGPMDHLAKPIQARAFLEKGLETMVEALPFEYERLIQSWIERSKVAGTIFVEHGGTFFGEL